MGLWSPFLDEALRETVLARLPGVKGISLVNHSDSIYVGCEKGSFELRECTGNIVASVHLYVDPEYRRQGWADRFEDAKIALARKAGAEIIIASVSDSNEPELAALRKHGWQQVGFPMAHHQMWGKSLK